MLNFGYTCTCIALLDSCEGFQRTMVGHCYISTIIVLLFVFLVMENFTVVDSFGI